MAKKVALLRIVIPTPHALTQASEHLLRGELVALPTETVYGLGADATQDKAVAKIYALKQRPSLNPLIIHFAHVRDMQPHVEWDSRAEKLASSFWPGPLTLVLRKKASSSLSSLAMAGLETVGVRIPRHEVTLSLLSKVGKPLAAPSANPSEALSPTSAQDVLKGFPSSTSLLVLDGGPCAGGIESTIVDLSEDPPFLLRPGLISRQEIENVLQAPLKILSQNQRLLTSPGQMKRHYAPHLPLRINVSSVSSTEALLAFGPSSLPGSAEMLNLSPQADLQEAAANFFRMVRALDRPCFSGIAVMPIPLEGIGLALNDRLTRATAEKEA